ncbi:MAG TPA: GTPase [Candidatus Limnocylindria bacterium]
MTQRGADASAAELVDRSRELAELAERRLALDPVAQAARERARQLRDHLQTFVRPRAADVDAPLLIVLLGPTGAGKSSLLNTIAAAEVSRAGVLRPTTRDAVLYATDDDARRLLSDGRLRLVARDRVRHVTAPAGFGGVTVVDAPDIDSVERDNRALADVLLEACDLCVFVTTATRYADLVPWEVLRRIRERGLPLLVVLNRLPPDAHDRDVVISDAARLLERSGSAEGTRAAIELIPVGEGEVDPSVNGLSRRAVRPLLQRIERLVAESEERHRLATEALAGAVRGLAPLVHCVADDLEHEAIDADALRRIAEQTFAEELAALSRVLRGELLLRAEVLRRWHDFVGADQVTRFISSGIDRLRGLVLTAFRGTPVAPIAVVEEEMAGTLEALALRHASEAARRTAARWSERSDAATIIDRDPGLWSASADLAPALRTSLGDWMHGIVEDVRAAGGRKHAVAKVAALGVNAIGVAVMLGVFAHTAGLTGTELGVAAGTAFLNQKLLEAIFGERAMEELIDRARRGLEERLASLFVSERRRFDALVAEPVELRDLAERLRLTVDRLAA